MLTRWLSPNACYTAQSVCIYTHLRFLCEFVPQLSIAGEIYLLQASNPRWHRSRRGGLLRGCWQTFVLWHCPVVFFASSACAAIMVSFYVSPFFLLSMSIFPHAFSCVAPNSFLLVDRRSTYSCHIVLLMDPWLDLLRLDNSTWQSSHKVSTLGISRSYRMLVSSLVTDWWCRRKRYAQLRFPFRIAMLLHHSPV
jgi:hypothetical protein